MTKMVYDLIVLGGGPGGYHGALQAASNNLKTLLIEKDKLGGVCLNEGCIPTKTLLQSAKVYHHALHSEVLGVTASNVEYHHEKVLKRKNEVSAQLRSGIRGQLKASGVEVIEGYGQILRRQADGFLVGIGEEVVKGKRLLLATGASPVIPPIPGLREALDQGIVLTSREILDVSHIPESLTIIGGGVIGLEMAEYFAKTGSRVTVIEMQNQIGGPIDSEISTTFLKILKQKGIQFELNAKVQSIDHHQVTYEKQGKTFRVDSEYILVCTGRKPNIENLGLESLGVETIKGCVSTDETGQTNIPNVYAVGDLNGKSMLAHTAYREAEVCIQNILGKKDQMRYHTIPAVIYTTPEVAYVGETEESALAKGIDYAKVNLPLNYSGRYVVEQGDRNGFIKIVIDKQYNQIIGVHLLGNYASEIIYGASMMLETEMRTSDIEQLVFPHPSVSEVIKDAIHQYIKIGG
jgi:dihydrolipoamide dehydrogenase